MPEVHFTIRWPNGIEETCYSPSTAIHQHLSVGQSYLVADFLDRARAGLQAASNRVEAKFGYHCSSALDQLARIEMQAALQPQSGQVACIAMR